MKRKKNCEPNLNIEQRICIERISFKKNPSLNMKRFPREQRVQAAMLSSKTSDNNNAYSESHLQEVLNRKEK